MSELKKGDRVRFTSATLHKIEPEFYPKPGTVGEIIFTHKDTEDSLVQWPKGATRGFGRWYALNRHLELVKDTDVKMIVDVNVVIYVDKENPRMVIATDLKTGKTGIARCNPKDKFDFGAGATLAVSRLYGKETDVKPSCKFEKGDLIIGNKKADRYGITSKGWIGVVEKVFANPIVMTKGCDEGKKHSFRARGIYNNDVYDLCDDAFDLLHKCENKKEED